MKGGGTVKRKKRSEPAKGKWRSRYLQLFLNQANSERDKNRRERMALTFYVKTFQLNMKKLRQSRAKYVLLYFYYLVHYQTYYFQSCLLGYIPLFAYFDTCSYFFIIQYQLLGVYYIVSK